MLFPSFQQYPSPANDQDFFFQFFYSFSTVIKYFFARRPGCAGKPREYVSLHIFLCWCGLAFCVTSSPTQCLLISSYCRRCPSRHLAPLPLLSFPRCGFSTAWWRRHIVQYCFNFCIGSNFNPYAEGGQTNILVSYKSRLWQVFTFFIFYVRQRSTPYQPCPYTLLVVCQTTRLQRMWVVLLCLYITYGGIYSSSSTGVLVYRSSTEL